MNFFMTMSGSPVSINGIINLAVDTKIPSYQIRTHKGSLGRRIMPTVTKPPANRTRIAKNIVKIKEFRKIHIKNRPQLDAIYTSNP